MFLPHSTRSWHKFQSICICSTTYKAPTLLCHSPISLFFFFLFPPLCCADKGYWQQGTTWSSSNIGNTKSHTAVSVTGVSLQPQNQVSCEVRNIWVCLCPCLWTKITCWNRKGDGRCAGWGGRCRSVRVRIHQSRDCGVHHPWAQSEQA